MDKTFVDKDLHF